eukprot:687385-Alexandrium_andersonii.AAC.1
MPSRAADERRIEGLDVGEAPEEGVGEDELPARPGGHRPARRLSRQVTEHTPEQTSCRSPASMVERN